jgi:uncharacterized protein YbdZ (MbtH family)
MKNQRYAGQSNYSLRFPRDKKRRYSLWSKIAKSNMGWRE